MRLASKIVILVILAFCFIQSKRNTKGIVSFLEDINYETHVKPIIKANCLRCHAGKRPKAKLDLSVYANLVDAIKNKDLLIRINDSKKPMPKDGLMTESERVIIFKWMENNFQKTP